MAYLRNFLPMHDRYFTLTKVGNTSMLNTKGFLLSTTLRKVCPEKETVWTTA